MNGWIKLHRKSLDSRVFSDAKCWQIWSYLLMKANRKIGFFEGMDLAPGQLATSTLSISKNTKIPKSTVHRIVKRLEKWDQIKTKAERNFTVVTICNWKTYQQTKIKRGTQVRRKRDESGEPVGHPWDTRGEPVGSIGEGREFKEGREREEEKKEDSCAANAAAPQKRKSFTKPCLEEIRSYCQERGNKIDPEAFLSFYESNGWKVGRNPMKDWKSSVRYWEKNSYGNGKSNTNRNDSAKRHVSSSEGDNNRF